MRYLIAFLLMVSLPVHGQALWRNFFTTNQNPRVTVAAGSNTTVQASTVGVDQRIFTVNSVPPTNVAYASFATNASNATNFWGVLNTTNIPSLNYISNNVGWGTNTSFSGVVNASNEVLTLSGIGTTISPIFWLTNPAVAALGAQQASPALMLSGNGWRSGNSTTMPVQMGMYVLPVQGSSANPSATLNFVSSVSNSVLTANASISSDGAMGIGSLATLGYGLDIYRNDTTGFRSLSGASMSSTSGSGLIGGTTQTPGSADQRLGFLVFSGASTQNALGIAGYSAESWGGSGKGSYLIFQTTPIGSASRVEKLRITDIGNLAMGGVTATNLMLKVESTNNPTLSIRTGADGNYASLVASNVTASSYMSPTNGIVFQGKHAFTTNFTAVESIQLYNCNGTNIVITLPNCTNTTPWKIYRFSQTNSYASFTLTNANGLQTIHNGIDLSYSIRSAKQTAVYHDGAHWWLAVPDQPNFPNAQFSCSTNIPLTAANTAYPVTFNSTDFNNSLGIGLGLGTNGLHSKMWLTNSGVYEFGPSVVQSFNGNDTIRFWFRTFDTNVPASATPSKGQNGSIRVITVPFVISVTQPTPVEIWAESDTTGESLPAEAASGNYPAAPCVICPVKMISHAWP